MRIRWFWSISVALVLAIALVLTGCGGGGGGQGRRGWWRRRADHGRLGHLLPTDGVHENGKPVGFDIDLMNEIAKRATCRPSTRTSPSTGSSPALATTSTTRALVVHHNQGAREEGRLLRPLLQRRPVAHGPERLHQVGRRHRRRYRRGATRHHRGTEGERVQAGGDDNRRSQDLRHHHRRLRGAGERPDRGRHKRLPGLRSRPTRATGRSRSSRPSRPASSTA